MARQIIAASIGYVDSSLSPTGQVLYVATEGFTTNSGDTPASTYFQGRLAGDISYKWSVASPFTGSKSASGIGALNIVNNDGGLDSAMNWEFRDGAVTVKMLDVGQDWSAGTVIATAIAENSTFNGVRGLRIALRDSAAILDQPIQQSTFTAGEAPDAENKVKPYAFGLPLSCEPVLINKTTRAYDVHDAAVVEIDKVRDNGLEVEFATTTNGFTLTNEPAGKVTCDPVASGTGSIAAIDDGVATDGALLSNFDRTIQNPSRTFDSPSTIDLTGHHATPRSAAAAGKWYFEMFVNNGSGFALGGDFPDGAWSTAIGIGAAIPTNTHRLSNADEYALWTTYAVNASFAAIDTWQDATRIDDDLAVTGSWASGSDRTIGVLVNFDDMQVSFRVDGVAKGTTLSITANSPLDSFYPLIAVAGSANTDLRNQDHRATIALNDEYFNETVPAGYTSWSGSAYSAATSFTNFVASITDKVSGLTVDTTTQSEMDDIGYSYGYYLKDSTTAARILLDGCKSHNGWYYIGREGSLTFGRLAEPTGAGTASFSATEIIDFTSISTDYAPGLSNRMGAQRNWTRLNLDSIDATLDEDVRVTLSDQYQHEALTANTFSSGYNHAVGNDILPTFFNIAADADAEIDRVTALYSQERRLIVIEAVFDLTQFTAITLGDTVSIDFSRFGFGSDAGSGAFSSGFSSGWDLGSAGSQYLVLAIEGNFISNRIKLTLWG